ncbi:J domain-containing protein [Gloeothece verrucosa]|uniref:Heat shock protein DnaJ domain protein n=1 Tax=Gloeothece verrucosa (strain PCC 7822) TaxID=497965 RepID=E0ULY4_GLOV7|nr:DnaJ domain-containing protein [Gloeothece verrucosa]ADN17964.1 heat shock protein DnaJ domain protein [Gloeothece verrucosa PCC 7822]
MEEIYSLLTYRELQIRLKSARNYGHTKIRLNSTKAALLAEYKRCRKQYKTSYIPEQKQQKHTKQSATKPKPINLNTCTPRQYLQVFGLQSSNANRQTIKKAYFALAKQHHPDQGGNPDSFRKIYEIYQHLLTKYA